MSRAVDPANSSIIVQPTSTSVHDPPVMPKNTVQKKLFLVPPANESQAEVVDRDERRTAQAWKALEKNPPLRVIYENLVKQVGEFTHAEAVGRYRIGAKVLLVKNNEARYGSRAVESLAVLLGYEKSTLHDYVNVAETWERADFIALSKRKNEKGLPLRFSHFVVLARVSDGRRRNGFITRALEESLTVRQLEDLVRRELGGDDAEAPAETADKDEAKVQRVVARWEAATDELDRDTRALVQLAEQNRTPEVLRLVTAAADRQRALAAAATACADKLVALASSGIPQKAR